tara:strand:- start:5770 stop:6582 length:813 start_codon:yes stop_codon:yes gene_type:complete
VDGGIKSTRHKNFYEVECDYLVEEIEKVVAMKGMEIEINIDSVGEPFCYPKLEELIEKIRAIPNVHKISIQTNGTIWKDVKVDVLNLSLHALDPVLSKKLADGPCFSIDKLKENAMKWKANGVKVRLCPVWIPGINDEEMPKIIQYAKENDFMLGIQKYEVYKHSRKVKGVKAVNYWKFYRQLEKWEKEFDIFLKVKAKDLRIKKAPRVPEVFKKGEKVYVDIVAKGWFEDQMIAKEKNRCISINNCNKEVGDVVPVTILETKNNIYLAE